MSNPYNAPSTQSGRPDSPAKHTPSDPTRSARNWMIGVACFGSIPLLVLLLIAILPAVAPVIWDTLTFGLLGVSLLNIFLAGLAAALIHSGKQAGRVIGHVPACIICLFFPIGTIVGVSAIKALNR